MASSAELSELYGELRTALLSRHFALGRYYRANLISLGNNLGVQNEPRPCDEGTAKPNTYADYKDLLTKDKVTQLKERWRITYHGRENPLMNTGLLLICLAVEHVLGRSESIKIIREALASLASLYKFKGNHFDGYILRWDPVTSDRWLTTVQNGKPIPRYCCEFLISPDNKYLYCTPFDNPRYTPGDWHSFDWYRRWEPSMDELVGLIMGYFILWDALKDRPQDAEIVEEVRRQVRNLGDYLAEHSYLLVRPCGGFTARGASGSLAAFEFPFGRVFERITGDSFPSRAGFEDALRKAGVWNCLSGPLFWGTVGGVAVGGVLAFLLASTGLGAIIIGVLGVAAGVILGRTAAILASGGCFDVQNNEFAWAYLLKNLPIKMRFTTWLWFVGFGKGPASNFPPYIGLTGLDDPDTTVRDSYIGWFNKGDGDCFATAVAVVLGAGEGDVLEESDILRKLVGQLDKLYMEFVGKWERDLDVLEEGYSFSWDKVPGEQTAEIKRFIKENFGANWVDAANTEKSADGNTIHIYTDQNSLIIRLDAQKTTANLEMDDGRTYSFYTITENSNLKIYRADHYVVEGNALGYMACLALTWLYVKRRKDAGLPIPPWINLPGIPVVASWPQATVPKEVIKATLDNEIEVPLNYITNWGELGPMPVDSDLFGDPQPPPKPKEDPPPNPPVKLPPESSPVTHHIEVHQDTHWWAFWPIFHEETIRLKAPPIPPGIASSFVLGVRVEVDPSTIEESVTKKLPPQIEGDEVVVTIGVGTGWFWTHPGHYAADYTLYWAPSQ